MVIEQVAKEIWYRITFISNHALVIAVVISLLNGHHWLNFWTSFTKYDIFGKVTQKFMGKWLKKLWGNATKSWGNDAKLWGNDAKLWGNDSKTMGKWLNIMGKWSKILWGIASTAKWVHPDPELFPELNIFSIVTKLYEGLNRWCHPPPSQIWCCQKRFQESSCQRPTPYTSLLK